MAIGDQLIDRAVGACLGYGRQTAELPVAKVASKLRTVQPAVYVVETGRQGLTLGRLFDWCDVLGLRPDLTLRAALDAVEALRPLSPVR